MNVNAKAQYDFADQLSTSLQLDTRVRAIWLEGSLGNTTNADAYSDIDLHLLVNDESAFRQDIAKLISSIAPVLVYLPMNFGAMSAMVLFENMQKLEVWIESQTPTILIEKSKVLFDPENTLQQVETQPAKLEDLRFALEQCLGNFWFGVSHTLGIKSGEFIAAVRGLSNQVDYFVTVKILEQKKFRDVGGGRNNRYLTPAVQKELEGILALPEVTAKTLVAAHLRLAELMREHGRTAASSLGIAYPEALEQAVMSAIRQKVIIPIKS